jgi:hypothetical protein
MMEKRGVIQPGITPPEDDKPDGEKTASLEELEDNATKRLAAVPFKKLPVSVYRRGKVDDK